MKKFSVSALLILITITISSCYYDNVEELYPATSGCDTTNVTYSLTIAPIVNQNCNVCHSSSIASGGVITATYSGLKTVADNGRLLGAINHASGFARMPQGGSKLSACNILKITTWVNKGTPQN